MKGFEADPRYTVTEWAESYRVLTSEASAESGLYRVGRTPFLKEIMDELSPTSPTVQVKVIKGTQLGFSTVADNVAMCYLDLYPCPILYILPTETLAKGTSKRRLTPSIRAIPRLADKITGGKTKEDVGEMYSKAVAGGNLTLAWSQSTASFRSFSARVVLLDDVDGFGSFGEGDVLELGKARADAFSNKKIYINSTPTLKGSSNIETEFEDSDQREYFMPCPSCEEMMVFKWEYMVYEVDHRGYRKGDVKCGCPHCGTLINEYQKTAMMAKGKWIPQNPDHEHRGYKLPSFYSPLGWLGWNEIASEFIKAHKLIKTGDTRLMQTWKNTRCAEVFEQNLKGIDIKNANERVEDYGCEVPNEVYIITCGVDTQDDRFECEILGHGKNGETWSIDYKVIAGDPKFKETQDELDKYLQQTFTRKDGNTMKINGTAIDTGGHRTQAMYQYCEDRCMDNVFGIKGANQPHAPVTNKNLDTMKYGEFDLVSLGVSTIKDDFFARLGVRKHGNNFCHFPAKGVYNDKYFRMLTAEKLNDKGVYVKVRLRNEALDCRVYAIGALHILNADISTMPHPAIQMGTVAKPVNNQPERQGNYDMPQHNTVQNYLDEF